MSLQCVCQLAFAQMNLKRDLHFYCRLLITFSNSLEPDQARQNVGPDLDPNCLTAVIPGVVFEEVDFEINRRQKHPQLPSMQRVKLRIFPTTSPRTTILVLIALPCLFS